MGLASMLGKIAAFWEATQVELHGFYSVERVREFIQYSQHTSMFRAAAILALMPWPCVIITILVDMIPLRPPTEGPNANYLFMVRTFLAFWISTIAISLQFRHSVPSVGLSNIRIMVNGVFTAVLSTSVLYALSLVVGFPLPFGILIVSPAWVTFMLIPLASFVRRARSDPAVWLQIMNTLKTWVGQESLVLIYPTYFYVFTTLPTSTKTPFAMLLPIIKIFMRNVMSRTVVHLNDEIPEVVLMNVEVFNSLFMSYCMQNSPSIWTTLGLIAIDGAQMLASMSDVSDVIHRLGTLKERVNEEHARLSLDNPTGTEVIGLRRKTILVYTEDIFDRYQSTQKSPTAMASTMVIEGSTQSILPKVVHREAKVKPKTYKSIPKYILYSPTVLSRSKLVKRLSLSRKVFLSRDVDDVEGKVDVTQLELEYAMKVRKLLYITEFVLLINYVEVIVPIIFAANLVVMYHLPNSVYYSQISSMDDQHLWDTIGNVMLYAFLQLVSLVLLFALLWQRLHISAVRQLAFVLEKQGEQVQTKLVFWVFYNVQASLQHYGKSGNYTFTLLVNLDKLAVVDFAASDYTFKFAWLHGTP